MDSLVNTDALNLEAKPPWERLAHEEAHAYAWFVRYCEMYEQRSVDKVARFCGVPVSLVRKAAAENAWEPRADAFDSTIARVVDSVQIDDSEALAMQFAVGKMMLRLGIDKIKLINPAMLKTKEVFALLQAGSEMMRRGAGIADLTIEQRSAQDRVERTFLELLGD